MTAPFSRISGAARELGAKHVRLERGIETGGRRVLAKLHKRGSSAAAVAAGDERGNPECYGHHLKLDRPSLKHVLTTSESEIFLLGSNHEGKFELFQKKNSFPFRAEILTDRRDSASSITKKIDPKGLVSSCITLEYI